MDALCIQTLAAAQGCNQLLDHLRMVEDAVQVAAKDVAHAAPVCLLAGSAVALLQDTEGGAGCVWVVCVV